MRHIVYLAAITLFVASPASAGCAWAKPEKADAGMLDRVVAAGLSVRKSFVGKKDEAQPAAVSYAEASEGDPFYNVDIGIRHSGVDCGWGESPMYAVLVFPSVEWHRSSVTTAEVNKVTASVNTEHFLFRPVARRQFFALVKPSLTRDLQADQTSGSASLMFSSLARGASRGPGVVVRRADGSFAYRYYPYIGVEYHRNLAITKGLVRASDLEATFGLARVYLEWFPFNTEAKPGRFQVITEATVRGRVGGDAEVSEWPWLLSSGITYYFDDARRAGVGYDFEVGRNPANNFERLRVSTLNFKFKL